MGGGQGARGERGDKGDRYQDSKVWVLSMEKGAARPSERHRI